MHSANRTNQESGHQRLSLVGDDSATLSDSVQAITDYTDFEGARESWVIEDAEDPFATRGQFEIGTEFNEQAKEFTRDDFAGHSAVRAKGDRLAQKFEHPGFAERGEIFGILLRDVLKDSFFQICSALSLKNFELFVSNDEHVMCSVGFPVYLLLSEGLRWGLSPESTTAKSRSHLQYELLVVTRRAISMGRFLDEARQMGTPSTPNSLSTSRLSQVPKGTAVASITVRRHKLALSDGNKESTL
jgi:hypothetical protein